MIISAPKTMISIIANISRALKSVRHSSTLVATLERRQDSIVNKLPRSTVKLISYLCILSAKVTKVEQPRKKNNEPSAADSKSDRPNLLVEHFFDSVRAANRRRSQRYVSTCPEKWRRAHA